MDYPTAEEIKSLEEAALPGVVNRLHLLNPEDAGTERDFLRITKKEEDRKFLEMQKKMVVPIYMQKKFP